MPQSQEMRLQRAKTLCSPPLFPKAWSEWPVNAEAGYHSLLLASLLFFNSKKGRWKMKKLPGFHTLILMLKLPNAAVTSEIWTQEFSREQTGNHSLQPRSHRANGVLFLARDPPGTETYLWSKWCNRSPAAVGRGLTLTAVPSGFHPGDAGASITVPSCQVSYTPYAYQQLFISVSSPGQSYCSWNIISIMEWGKGSMPQSQRWKGTPVPFGGKWHNLTFQLLARAELCQCKSSNTQSTGRKIRKKAQRWIEWRWE